MHLLGGECNAKEDMKDSSNLVIPSLVVKWLWQGWDPREEEYFAECGTGQ